jgi:hypothetical protein
MLHPLLKELSIEAVIVVGQALSPFFLLSVGLLQFLISSAL